jgi:hypothetical protein
VIGDVYLAGRTIEVEASEPVAAAPSAAQLAWDMVENSESVAVLESFAEEFSGSVYASFARARAEELKLAALPPAAVDPAHASKLTGKYSAILGGSGAGEMEISTNRDGSQFFGAEVWFENGHSCGLSGTATPVTEGWRYTDGSSCILELRSDGAGKVTLRAEPDADCADYCGARARLDGISFRLMKP